jgi:hypothetical protein
MYVYSPVETDGYLGSSSTQICGQFESRSRTYIVYIKWRGRGEFYFLSVCVAHTTYIVYSGGSAYTAFIGMYEEGSLPHYSEGG